MKIFADLHVHSKYSRATARDLDLENLYLAARIKGIQVVGTGDFSHPAWFGEIEAKLEPAEPGLLRLRPEIAGKLDERVPPSCRGSVRFVLTTEISNIYKKHGRTRKNHNLVFVPDLDTAGKLNSRLERIGNIHSDGRPILGLDARDLLEIVLETSPDAFLVPAHIWTPWFSVLGSKSGFDSIAECFGDLATHVFAAETGLSSDPGMNWRVSGLDDVALISNSDAHSPANLGREANVFNTDLSLYAIRDALKGADPERFLGTIEFYPEEGKYHLDGHRACGVCFEPEQTASHEGLCPRCGKPLTIGVLNRVEQLADRPQGVKPEKARPYRNLVPLMGILGEIFQVGAKTKKASQAYRTAIEKLGPEFAILDQLDVREIEGAGIPLLGEAVRRMRAKEMHIRPGYDGEYGIVTIFDPQERARMLGQKPLFSAPATEAEADTVSTRAGRPAGVQLSEAPRAPAPAEKRPPETVVRLNEDQRKAVLHAAARLMILAGPGTGKTHTLTCRIAHLIADGQAEPQHILAVTFTHKAAEEMRQRLQAMGSGRAPMPCIATFHSLCLSLLQESNPNDVVTLVDEGEQTELVAEALERAVASGCPAALRPPALQARIVRAKQYLIPPDHGAPSPALPPEEACFRAVYQTYQKLLESQGQLDFEDLIFRVVNRLESDPQFLAMCRIRFRHIFVDEYQDLNHGQYRLIRALAPTQGGGGSLCVIGDPDQSIYGFRGSDSSCFRRFIEDYPGAGVVTLTRNYRSTETILSASRQVLAREDGGRARIYSNIAGVRTISIRELPNEHAEVEAIARIIESLVGATGFHSIDTGRVKDAQGIDGCGYGDVAVLVRTNQQLRFLAEGLKASGIPFQAANRRYLLNRKGVVELIALLKLLSGVGGYADAARVAERMAPALGRKTLRTFKQWSLENRLAVKDALAAVPRFPIPGLSRGRQVQFSDFAARLAGLSRETAGLTPVEILCRLKGIPEIAQLLDADDSREGMRLITAHAEAAGSGPKELLDRLALQSDTDVYHPRAEKTALMTMHSAKGLEFPVVVIAGCETGFIPFQRESREPVDVDEERRLFYVAMTRSRERLYLTYAKRRRVFGRTENRELSVFVKDIAAGLLKHESARSKPGRPKAYQQPLF